MELLQVMGGAAGLLALMTMLAREHRHRRKAAIAHLRLRALERSEAALHHDVLWLQRLTDQCRHVYWSKTLNPERVLYVSAAFESIWGYHPQDLKRDPALWRASIHPDDRARVVQALQAWHAGLAPDFDEEYRILRRDGQIRWVRDRGGIVVRDAQGNCMQWCGVAEDYTERKAAELALAHKRELMQNLVDHIPVMIMIQEPILPETRINREFTRVLGWSGADAANAELTRSLLPDPAQHEAFQWHVQSVDAGWRDFAVCARDGCKIDSSWTGTRLSSGTRIFLGIDMRERRAAEQALHRSEALITATLDALPLYLAVVDREGIILAVNAAWSQVAERRGNPAPGQIAVGTNYLDACRKASHVTSAQQAVEGIEAVLTGQRDRYELEYAPDGTEPGQWFLMNVRPLGLPEGGAVISHLDITARHQAERAACESIERLERVLETAQIGIRFGDETGRIHSANDTFCRITGYTQAQIRAGEVSWKMLVAPEYQDCNPCLLTELAENGRTPPHEKELIRPDGSRVPVLVSAALLDRQPHLHVAFVVDLSEQKRAQAELREAARRKDEFLAMLGHELRNPLAPIRNAVHILGHCVDNGPQLEWARDLIERQVVHLARMIDDLLDVSRIISGKIRLQPEPVALDTIIDQALDEVRPAIEARRQTLSVHLPPEPVLVHGDRVRLVQVFANLLDNATKYTGPAGSLWLDAWLEEDAVAVRVRDNGSGIPASLLPRIFDLFQQGERSLDRSEGGLGLGLTIVKHLLDLHGGRIEAESAGPGTGSSFTAVLPVAGPACPAIHAAPEAAGHGCAGLRVLVVDDDPAVAESMAKFLELEHCTVQMTGDGASALELVRDFDPQVLLLDIGLRGLDGFQVAARLRQERQDLRSPLLIAVSGYGQDSYRDRARDAGFDHYLVKPVDLNRLLALLHSAAASQSTAPSAAIGPGSRS